MKKLFEFFAENDVIANLLMISLIFGGVVAGLYGVQKEVLPDVTSDVISITTFYPGAAPEDVERGVTILIEEEINGIEGIKRITSTSSEGLSAVRAELIEGGDNQKVLDEIKSAVDAIDNFPEEAERPTVVEVTRQRHVINVAVSGDVSEHTLRRYAEKARDEITTLEELTKVDLIGARPYEISIEVDEAALRGHRIEFSDVVNAINSGSIDLPAGEINAKEGDILIRSVDRSYEAAEFAAIPLITQEDGSTVTIGDVATVLDTFERTGEKSFFDNQPAMLIQVYRVGDQSALAIAEAVKNYVERAQDRFPESIHLTTWRDRSVTLKGRMGLLLKNGWQGLILVFIILALFLRFRLAFWVVVGIPISFLGALLSMNVFDVSINMISLFAFILALGLVVDDAIVVAENIYTNQARSGVNVASSTEGVYGVCKPVIFGVVTTCAAFAPLLFVSGNMGKFIIMIPMVVLPILFFSLVESHLILPSHLAHGSESPSRFAPFVERFEARLEEPLRRFVQTRYRDFVEMVLRHKGMTLAIFVFILLITIGVIGGGWLKFIFFPKVEADNVIANLTMPRGTPEDVTTEIALNIEKKGREILEKLREETGVSEKLYQHILTAIGSQPTGGASASGPHTAEIDIQLSPAETRDVASEEIARAWRAAVGAIPGAEELTFQSSLFSSGEPISVEISSVDNEQLLSAIGDLKAKLALYQGVYDIADSYRAGKKEIKLTLKDGAASSGVTAAMVARQARAAYYGAEAQRIQRGRDEVTVMARYPERAREDLASLSELRITLPNKSKVPISAVADMTMGRGYASIDRTDRRRAARVNADVDETLANASEINTDLADDFLPQLRQKYPDISYSFEGQEREQSDSINSLKNGYAIALFVIFALLAVPLSSYIQPLIIMSAIPFGLIGAVWGHLLTGYDFSFMSLMGAVALSGVVINSSLVLVTYANEELERGSDLHSALIEASVNRFRPIALTAMTTFAGVTPILLERSLQAQFLIPMAVSLGFGVLFATTISLLLTPILTLTLERIRVALGFAPASKRETH